MCQTLMLKFGVKFAFAHQNTLEMDGSTDTAFRFHISLFYDYHSNYENVLVNGIFASNNNKIDKKAHTHTNFSISTHHSCGICSPFFFLRLPLYCIEQNEKQTNDDKMQSSRTANDLKMQFFSVF